MLSKLLKMVLKIDEKIVNIVDTTFNVKIDSKLLQIA